MIKAEPKRSKTFSEAVEENYEKPTGFSLSKQLTIPRIVYSLPKEVEQVKVESINLDKKKKPTIQTKRGWNKSLTSSLNYLRP